MKKVEDCDLMLVMGTALAVSPFNQLPHFVNQGVPLVLINMNNTKETGGFDFERGNERLFLQGKCDEIIRKIVSDCGWDEDFEFLLPPRHRKKDEDKKAAAEKKD
jgi:NAD-dependent SIR2 family protein deacetylase